MTEEQIQAEDDQLITVDVARAVEEGELLAYYQPVIDFKTRRVHAAEALVRWTMPDGTIVPAALFVPSLERTNTISGLDWYMVEELCAFLEKAEGTTAQVPVALNLSTCHIADPNFADKFAAMADWRKLDHGLVRIEITQSLLSAGGDDIERLVKSVVEQGFTVGADNFKADAAELRRLADLGITVFKIARELWKDASVEDIRALVEAAGSRELTISVESVEEENELAKLVEAGITLGQGYYFAHPMDEDAFSAFCR